MRLGCRREMSLAIGCLICSCYSLVRHGHSVLKLCHLLFGTNATKDEEACLSFHCAVISTNSRCSCHHVARPHYGHTRQPSHCNEDQIAQRLRFKVYCSCKFEFKCTIDYHNAQEPVLTVANRSHGVRKTIELDYRQLHCRSDRM